MHPDGAAVDVVVAGGRVDEDADLLRADLRRTVAEDEEQRVDHIALPATVRADDRCEVLKGNVTSMVGRIEGMDYLQHQDQLSSVQHCKSLVYKHFSWLTIGRSSLRTRMDKPIFVSFSKLTSHH